MKTGNDAHWETRRMQTQGGQHSCGIIVVATWVNLIVKQAPGVHPHFRQSHIVAVYDATRAPGKRIGGGLTEDMPDVGTGDNEQRPPAHPYLMTSVCAWADGERERRERTNETAMVKYQRMIILLK